MKIAIGIVGIAFSIFCFLQSFTLLGLASISEDEVVGVAASQGLVVSFFMLIGGALAFGLPRVAGVMFLVAAFFSVGGSKGFPDLAMWAVFALILGISSLVVGISAKKKGTELAANSGHETTVGRQPDEKECPVCAELIKGRAVKCRFCGSDLPAE